MRCFLALPIPEPLVPPLLDAQETVDRLTRKMLADFQAEAKAEVHRKP